MGGGQIKLILFGLLWFSAVWIHQAPENPNAASRLDLLHALVRKGTWRIDAYHQNTTDKAYWKGHVYSDKPPGVALLALPGFVILDLLFGEDLDTPEGWVLSSWLACGAVVGTITACAGVACFAWLTRRTNPRAALIATVGLFLGSPLQTYATSWFPHAVTAGLILIALGLIDRACNQPSPCMLMPRLGAKKACFLAGLFCGAAWAGEYSAGLAAGAVGWLALRHGTAGLGRFVLGWLPPLFLVAVYHWLCFGTPFTIPYWHATDLEHMQRGFCGIHFPPAPNNLLHLLLSPTRGLFLWTPLLLFLLPGWLQLHRRDLAWFYASYLLLLAQSVLIAGYADVQAGNTTGPRLLLCVLPWLALPTALAAARFPRLCFILASMGCLLNGIATWLGLQLCPSRAGSFLAIPQRLLLDAGPAHHVGQFMPPLLGGTIYVTVQCACVAWLWMNTNAAPPPSGPTSDA